MGPVGEYRLMPDLDTFRVLPVRAAAAGRADRPLRPRRRAGAGLPAQLPQAHGRAPGRARADAAGRRSRTSSRSPRTTTTATYRPIDRGLCFSTIAMTASQRLRRGAGRRARGAGDPARAVLRRARPRPAGDLDRARAGAAGGRRAAARARDDPRRGLRRTGWSRRWRRSRGRRTRATAATCTSRCGRASATASTLPTGCRELALAFVAGVLEHLPGLCGLTAPSFNSYDRIAPGTWSGAFALLGLRQPRGAGAGRVAVPRCRGGVDQRRAQGLPTRPATRTSRSAG